MTLALAVVMSIAAIVAAMLLVQTRSQLRMYAASHLTAKRGMDLLGDIPGEVDHLRDELLQQNEALTVQRDVLLQILNGLGEGLLAVDRQRRVVLANPRFVQMFGLSGELVGRPLAEAVRVAGIFSAFDAALAGREASERFPVRTGVAERRIETRAFPLKSEDIAAVALFLDVTRLERLEQIRRDFIADFSHEVRTPLTGLKSAVDSFEIGAEHMSVEEDQQLRRIMARQLARLERLVNDISELSNIEFGAIPLERSSVDLYSLVRDLCEDFTERASQKGLRFDVRGRSMRVCADAMRIQQAISNLIDNAIKYGGANDAIEIDVHAEGDDGVVTIADHGEGVAPEERERIFRRFYRVDKSRSQDVAGTGLGLAITKHLVLLHGGTIDLESMPGEGATFLVRLPLVVAEAS